MSRIDDLIAEHCPEGVEFKALGNVVEVLDHQRKPISKDKREPGDIPYYGANGIQSYVKDFIFEGTYLLLGEDGSVINKDKSPVLNWAEGKIWVNNHAHVLGEKAEVASLRYVYFYLSTVDVSDVVRGTPPKINQANMRSIRVAIPPLEVQHKIVKVLDTFIQLNAELEAELEARRKQYQHYRDMLLGFEGREDVREMELGDVITALRTGLNPRQNFKLNPPDAKNYYVTVRELDGLNVRISDKTDRVDAAGLNVIQNRSKLQVGDVLFSGTGTIGRTALITKTPSTWNVKEGVYVITPNVDFINARFLIYLLHSSVTRNRILAQADGSTVVSIPMAALRKIRIPVPSLKEQARIVAILDKFDSLVNDISTGLPAEIKARRQQYEHYRDHLLTFKEAV